MDIQTIARTEPLTVAVVGAGVVGTATGEGFLSRGHAVTFCDVSAARLRSLRTRGLDAVAPGDLAARRHDAYLISVPSPTVDGRVDLTAVRSAAETVGAAIRGHAGRPLVVVRSTVPPGTTEAVVRPIVARASGRADGEFGLCMNPEFLREASAFEDFVAPRVIVIGADDEESERALRAIYAPWADVPVATMAIRAAELTKYTSNLFNAAKISFFNELELVCRGLDVDARAVFDAVAHGAEGQWNPRYGTRGLYPYGGACLPKDTVGFLGYVEDALPDLPMPMLRATIATNERVEAAQQPVDLAEWRDLEPAPAAQAS